MGLTPREIAWNEPLEGNSEWRVVIEQTPDGQWRVALKDRGDFMATSVGGFRTKAEADAYNRGEKQ